MRDGTGPPWPHACRTSLAVDKQHTLALRGILLRRTTHSRLVIATLSGCSATVCRIISQTPYNLPPWGVWPERHHPSPCRFPRPSSSTPAATYVSRMTGRFTVSLACPSSGVVAARARCYRRQARYGWWCDWRGAAGISMGRIEACGGKQGMRRQGERERRGSGGVVKTSGREGRGKGMHRGDGK